MEDVLEVYARPYDADRPVVCVDEAGKQLIGDVRPPLPVRADKSARYDSEYLRGGVANLFMAFEPLAGKRHVEVTDRKTSIDFARLLRMLSDERYPAVKQVVLVCDNLSTHTPAALYEAFAPEDARRLARRFEWHYTPKHGSWLDVAEIELSILARQCLDRRIPDMQTLKREVSSWEQARNTDQAKVNWQFKTTDARIKLRTLYPTIQLQ